MTRNNLTVTQSPSSSSTSSNSSSSNSARLRGTPNGDNRVTANRSSPGPNAMRPSQSQRERERYDRENIVLWKQPITTIEYSVKEIAVLAQTYGLKLVNDPKAILIALGSLVALGLFYSSGGLDSSSAANWACYWIGLGVLSSVGLGTGLHTFLLYLGPHIAKVTIAAYECGALNFPEPPYPDRIICPSKPDYENYGASIWNIMTKVRLEAMLWGAGTALGELPPYFMARAARLSGYDPDDELDIREFEELQRKRIDNPEGMTALERLKLFVERLVERVGFFGILACASIPNPLFDLAGITCGHFLVPFWTFFGATLIGKAVIKMHIQKMFVIIAFNDKLIQNAVAMLDRVPVVGVTLQEPFKEFLRKQKTKLHKNSTDGTGTEESSLLAAIFEKFVFAMIIYFLISIVNSLAQSYHKRIHKRNRVSSKVKPASD